MSSLPLRRKSISSNMADQMAIENVKETEQDINGPMTSHEVVTLETLPNEIISSIAVMMTVDTEIPYVVSRLDSVTKTTAARKKEDANARRDLTSLCMASKRIASNAQKALYRTILIDDVNTLILLFRAFLGNPKLGIYVKQMSLNILHKGECSIYRPIFFDIDPIDLGPLLSFAQNGLEEYLTAVGSGNRIACLNTAIEILYTLQLRVLNHTSNLQSLDLNVQPQFLMPFVSRVLIPDVNEAYETTVKTVFRSLWKDTSPSLSRLKKMRLIGEDSSYLRGNRSDFVASICKRFLTLPKLEQLVWFDHADGWFDTFAPWTMHDIHGQLLPGTEARFESMKTLMLLESSCFPQELITLCSAFPYVEDKSYLLGAPNLKAGLCIFLRNHHLQLQRISLTKCSNLQLFSVETSGSQFKTHKDRGHLPPHILTNADHNSGTGVKYLTSSLATLENLNTLTLDLHCLQHSISPTLGPSGILSLAGLPNLQTLAIPFQFFVKEELDGHHRVVSPAIVLPSALNTLRIFACFRCLTVRAGGIPPEVSSTYRHVDAVLEFLEGLSNLHAETFPSLSNIFYEASEPYHYDGGCVSGECMECRHPFRFLATPDILNLNVISESLRQEGVTFEQRARAFSCRCFKW